MRKTLINTLLLVVMLVSSLATFAVPADPAPITIRQSNGKNLTLVLRGDEKVHWAQTLDGYTIIRNSQKQFCYGQKDSKGDLIASNILAANQEERSSKEIAFLSTIPKDLRYSQNQINKLLKAWEPQPGRTKVSQARFPTTGTDSLLVILVAFSDLPFTYTNANFDSMCNQTNYNSTGSIKDYFLINSDSVFNLAIRVVGPVTLNHPMAYYGNTDTHPYGSYYFVRDAVNAADAAGVDFSHFDNDNDGYVDDICFIFAGTPESSTQNPDEIWPHSGEAGNYGQMPYKDGKNINRYSCSAEKRNSVAMDNIGTFCHEFGHVLGLPDEYDTDYGETGGESITVGSWSVMCNGSYNNNSNSPCLWSAFQKTYTHWLSLDTLTAAQDTIILPVNNGHNDRAYRINLSGDNFLVVEQRKKQGFDAYIPGNGMLIYHGKQNKINAWINNHNNTINVNPNDRGWYLIPATGTNVETSAAAFPNTRNITHYIDSANNVSITDIRFLNDSTMVFNYNSSIPCVTTKGTTGVNTRTSFRSLGGEIVYTGGSNIVTKGMVYSTSANCPYIADSIVIDSSNSANTIDTTMFTNLLPGTIYYYRAFAINQSGHMGLGDIRSATTGTGFGVSTTMNATNITETSAQLNGRLISTGEGSFVEKGFLYTTNDTLDIDTNNSTKVVVAGSTTGNYSYNLTGIVGGTTYYYCAFVTNSYGTFYGATSRFTTSYPAIVGNQISSNQQVCQGVRPNQLNGGLPTGGYGNFTYLWQQKSRTGNDWSDALGENTNSTYQPDVLTDSTYFRRIVISDLRAKDTSNVILIDVRISRGGYISVGRDNYMTNETAVMNLRQQRGDVVDWEKSMNQTNWSSLTNTTNSYQETFVDTGVMYYRVKVQIDQCPVAYSAIKAITVQANALDNISDNSNIILSPNPSTNGFVTIKAENHNILALSVTNSLGQMVYQDNKVNMTNGTDINLSFLQKGTYFVTIVMDNNIVTKKLIITK